jgi:hypothetical protein
MKTFSIRKIECPDELYLILDNLFLKHKDYLNNELFPPFFDSELVKTSICHENLLKGQISAWTLFKNKEPDSIFIGCAAKFEKINKKIYSEYLFLNSSKRGLLLIKEAILYAKKNKCSKFFLNATEKNKNFLKIENLLKKRFFNKFNSTYDLTIE